MTVRNAFTRSPEGLHLIQPELQKFLLSNYPSTESQFRLSYNSDYCTRFNLKNISSSIWIVLLWFVALVSSKSRFHGRAFPQRKSRQHREGVMRILAIIMCSKTKPSYSISNKQLWSWEIFSELVKSYCVCFDVIRSDKWSRVLRLVNIFID